MPYKNGSKELGSTDSVGRKRMQQINSDISKQPAPTPNILPGQRVDTTWQDIADKYSDKSNHKR